MLHVASYMLHDLVRQFLEHLEIERNLSQLTIRNYDHYLSRFLEFVAKNFPAVSSPVQLSENIIRQYRLFLSRFTDEHKLPLKKVTQGYHIIALRSFLKYLTKRQIKTIPSEMLDIPKGESRSLKFLDKEQMERLLKSPANIRDKAVLELLFSTGLRVSELVGLNKDDVNLERKEFSVIGKGGRIRVVFISESAAYWIRKYLEERKKDIKDSDKALFIRVSGRRDAPLRLTARSIQRLVEKYVKKAGLSIKITPHGIRHSFATDLLNAGADLRAIQEMLGHKSVATTQIYTHLTNPQLRKVHERFHRRK